ncbi:PREDICTED: uncharacterized protein LOC104594140 [Nelumbo nucifera]|uniref:Uncharacterized protein LOC104594140 n=2 Tax=Nelumbo nucifera TaxID=4432 RepID=A0A1U7ZUF9_NELNU|nr:PREDICTED: uncharacterized protein LOC104594140 [Nelumbo nucifera]DAD23524.1 TPA_asm: hypothetical protein HUJ06_024987 [Nelumbo nucifera]
MAKIPVRFKRVAAAFDDLARARLCDSSGSEHSAENSADLSDLIDSFMETDDRVDGEEDEEQAHENEKSGFQSDTETKDILQGLLGCDSSDGDEQVKRTIRKEVELACRVLGTRPSEGFKRQLMCRLRERGLDAGLCKSRWEKIGRFPAGDYEYIDVIFAGTRYIVEAALSGEFTIARPTNRYLSLLEVFPPIFVGEQDELKQVVKLMCAAAKESMKSNEMHVPPWRRSRYMQAKWFGSYKRTTNAVPAKKASKTGDVMARKRWTGFEPSPSPSPSPSPLPLPEIRYYCGGHIAKKADGFKAGNLAMVLSGMGL